MYIFIAGFGVVCLVICIIMFFFCEEPHHEYVCDACEDEKIARALLDGATNGTPIPEWIEAYFHARGVPLDQYLRVIQLRVLKRSPESEEAEMEAEEEDNVAETSV